MKGTSTIALVPAERLQRPYLQILVSGQPLAQLLTAGNPALDYIPQFGWYGRNTDVLERHAADRLLLRAAADLPSGRCSLLVCPECADLGCGAVTAFVEEENGLFVWRDFGIETDYQAEEERRSLERVYRLTFRRDDYLAAFERFASPTEGN